jgi:hypothetical protein
MKPSNIMNGQNEIIGEGFEKKHVSRLRKLEMQDADSEVTA